MPGKVFTPELITEIVKNSTAFEKVLSKVKFLASGGGHCLAELKVEEEHTNPMGSLHGGLSATLIDSVSSFGLLTHDTLGGIPSVSVDMHLKYLKGATIGDDILIDAKTIKAGKSLAFLEVDIKNKATGEILVKGSQTKYFMKKDSS